VNGEFPDLSKKHAFAPYLDLPSRVPEARWELAMNLNADDPEVERLRTLGWRVASPHRVARTPAKYRHYLAGALAEFTAIKGVDVSWRTGWVSDRAPPSSPRAASDHGGDGAQRYLPQKSGMFFVGSAAEAAVAAKRVLRDWKALAREARECAIEVFDSAKNLRKILGI
jgi:hypothetical protein